MRTYRANSLEELPTFPSQTCDFAVQHEDGEVSRFSARCNEEAVLHVQLNGITVGYLQGCLGSMTMTKAPPGSDQPDLEEGDPLADISRIDCDISEAFDPWRWGGAVVALGSILILGVGAFLLTRSAPEPLWTT